MAARSYMGIPREKIPRCPQIDDARCIGCGECLETCPNAVFVPNETTGKVEVANPDNCVVLCDKCAEFCPEEAISFPDKADTKRVIGELVKALFPPKENQT